MYGDVTQSVCDTLKFFKTLLKQISANFFREMMPT